MKRLLIFAAACLTMAASAQTKDVEALQKKMEKSDAAVADAKKGTMANTWIDRADLKIDMGVVFTNKLIAGQSAEMMILTLGEPKSIEQVTIASKPYSKHVYEYFDFYTDAAGTLVFWDARTEAIPDAFGSALADLTKAKELSAKDFAPKGKAITTVGRLYDEIRNSASNNYSLRKLHKAGELFEMAVKTKELEGLVDTSSYYYAGIAFFESEEFDHALKLFEKVATMGYEQDGNLAHFLSACQMKTGDNATALVTAEKGFSAYPNNTLLMGGLINVYMASNQNPEKLIGLIQKAQEMDPTNASLYLVESDIRNKLGQHQEAYAAIEKAIALDGKNFDAIYNYGILKVLEAEGLIEKANKLELNDTKNYNAFVEQAVALQKEAIGKLESAYELQKDNLQVVELLRQLYFPRRDDNAQMQTRYDFFNDLSKKLKGE